MMWDDIKDIPITDEDIQKRISSYKKQDSKAGREVVELSVDQVRMMLRHAICSHCGNAVTWSNWTLDRIDNAKSHSFDNLVLSCRHCNVKKKDRQQRIYFWDCETFPEGDFNEHIIYNVGLVNYDEGVVEDGNYQSIYDSTEVFYGEDAQERFENWLLAKSEEIRPVVEKRLESWSKWYHQENHNVDEDTFKKAVKRKRKELAKANKIILYAHNGANYDNHFIFKSKRLQFDEIIDSHGLINIVMREGYVEFRDTMRMTGPASLASLCKDFKLPPEYSKTEFPHKFASRDHLNYVGAPPPAEFWTS